MHFETIELSQHNFNPNCEDNKTVPVTVGFQNCKYRFHGLKAGGTQIVTGWTNVEGSDEYQQFDPKKVDRMDPPGERVCTSQWGR